MGIVLRALPEGQLLDLIELTQEVTCRRLLCGKRHDISLGSVDVCGLSIAVAGGYEPKSRSLWRDRTS